MEDRLTTILLPRNRYDQVMIIQNPYRGTTAHEID